MFGVLKCSIILLSFLLSWLQVQSSTTSNVMHENLTIMADHFLVSGSSVCSLIKSGLYLNDAMVDGNTFDVTISFLSQVTLLVTCPIVTHL